MALSRIQTTATGGTAIFSVPFRYISRAYVEVRVGGVLKTVDVDYEWLNATSIRLFVTPAAGTVVDRRRNTPKDTRLVDFQDGTFLGEADLDKNGDQMFDVAQEISDDIEGLIKIATDGTVDMEGRRVSNVGPAVEDGDAVTKGYADSVLNATQAALDAAKGAQADAEAAAALAATARSAAEGALAGAQSARDAAAGYAASISLPLPITSGGTGSATQAGARSALGLGTASTKDTGTAAGNVVQLDAGGKLPALPADQLTGLTRAQITTALGVKVKRIVTGPNYSMCMVITTDDKLVAWGGSNGVYGFGILQRAKPTEIQFPGETGTLVDAVCTAAPNCWALFSTGNLYAWGENEAGVLGTGDTTSRLLPVLVATGVTEMFPPTNVSWPRGSSKMFVRKSDGYIYGCGYNGFGQLGLGDTASRSSFVQLTSLGTTVRKLWNLGGSYGCTFVQKNDGSIWFAGNNTQGQCGDGTTGNNKTSFIDVTAAWGGGTAQIQEVSGGFGYYTTTNSGDSVVVMLRGGSVRACGYNGSGTCGDGTTTNRVTPYLVPGLGTVTDMVALGSPTSVFALSADGKLWRWGFNHYGNLGDGTTSNRLSPYNSGAGLDTAVTRLAIRQFDGHTYGFYTNIFFESGGRMYSCGSNTFGQCGIGSASATQTTFAAVRFSGPLYGISMVGGGDASYPEILAYDSKGDLYMWGYGGRYGIDQSSGDNNNVYVPIRKNIGSAC